LVEDTHAGPANEPVVERLMGAIENARPGIPLPFTCMNPACATYRWASGAG
jgi:hypothetical protein